MVVRLKLVELKYGVHLCITHVFGKGTQSQGTDGVFHGTLRSGVTAGEQIIDFYPLGRDPLEVESP